MAQEKAQAFHGKKVNGQFEFDRDKTVYVNHYYFYIDDEDFGPLFIKICSYAPWAVKLCLNGHEWVKRQLEKRKIAYEALDNGFLSCADRRSYNSFVIPWGPKTSTGYFANGSGGCHSHCAPKTGKQATTGLYPSGKWKSA